MKIKRFLLLMIGLSMLSTLSAQNIQPYLKYNILSTKVLNTRTTQGFIEIGGDYEHLLNDNLGLNGGVSYNLSTQSGGSKFVSLNLGGNYYFNEQNNGFYAGANFGYGFFKNGSYIEYYAKAGYSIELGNGSLKPHIGIGSASFGSNGFRVGSLLIPIGVAYSISL
jgi:hypothetical protein